MKGKEDPGSTEKEWFEYGNKWRRSQNKKENGAIEELK